MRSGSVRARTGQRKGFTLIEIIAAAALAAVIAGGSMFALVAAARMMRKGDTPATAEASGYAQQTIEKFRNMIACDSPWFTPGTCAPSGGMPTTLVSDPLPAAAAGDTESILHLGATRCYKVTSQDCDAGASPDDCFEIEVHVCWNGGACPC